MKLKARVCPKGCRIDKKQRSRMVLIANRIDMKYSSYHYRHDIELDWYCVLCGHREPVNMKDIRFTSRAKSASTGSTIRASYNIVEEVR
jgi:hypothetical protein